MNGAVISLDAKKAFDSVDHGYIKRCLTAFGLGRFIPVFNVLYKGLKSSIILNGKVIDGYSILRGVKQGDALSCILFIMCMEPLILNLKANASIEPIVSNKLSINIPRVYSFADDITVVAKNEHRGIQEVFNEYELFSNSSGLIHNADKTEILCFGGRNAPQQFNIRYNGSDFNIRSMSRIKVNGIFLSEDAAAREDYNVGRSIEAMERLL